MKKVVLYSPSIGSDNTGDQIIVDGVKEMFSNYLEDSFVIEMPTHTPINWRYMRYLNSTPSDLKLVCGSNLMVGKLNSVIHLRQWNIPLLTMPFIGPFIFVGIGAQQYNQKINLYTKLAYKYMMNPSITHSVRDSYTEKLFKRIGINNVINTGCPTMWGLTKKHCSLIPTAKSQSCITTLTDYKANCEKDNKLLSLLKKLYKRVYFWPQGNGDYAYFMSLYEHDGIECIKPSLNSYTTFLANASIDFIGTRLHGGIRALQKKKRTLIISVDNRATELHKDFGIPILQRENIDFLGDIVTSDFETSIKLPEENISFFLEQFK